jgi:hypothetical protein
LDSTSAVGIEYARIVFEGQPDCRASIEFRVTLDESVVFLDAPSILKDKGKIGVVVFTGYQYYVLDTDFTVYV